MGNNMKNFITYFLLFTFLIIQNFTQISYAKSVNVPEATEIWLDQITIIQVKC